MPIVLEPAYVNVCGGGRGVINMLIPPPTTSVKSRE